jgi:short-subunit dehydrogenase
MRIMLAPNQVCTIVMHTYIVSQQKRLLPAMMYAMTLSLKNEVVKIAPGARVNCVAPGWTKTPMAAKALEDEKIVYQALASYVKSQ